MKYIDSDKLIAEIKRRMFEDYNSDDNKADELAQGVCAGILFFITSLQQDLPEVDLDKFTDKVDAFKARYKHPESISVKGAMAFMARMFYQYPNVARQWYEQLPKATMD